MARRDSCEGPAKCLQHTKGTTEWWRAIKSSRWINFESSPGAIIGAIKWSQHVQDKGHQLIAQGVRGLGKSLTPDTKNVAPTSSRRSWIYSWRKKKKIEDTETATLPQKGPQLSDAEVCENVWACKTRSLCCSYAPPQKSAKPHLGLMKTRHWAGLGMPQNDYSPTCPRCAACSHPLSSHMLASVHRPLS